MNEQELILSLYYLDDDTLLNACQVNTKIYNRVCKNIWINKIVTNYGLNINDIELYRQNKSYSQYYYYLKNILSGNIREIFDDPQEYYPVINYFDQEGAFNQIVDKIATEYMLFEKYDVVKAALHLGASPNLDLVSMNENPEIFKLLVDRGYNPNLFLNSWAARYNPEFIEYLIEKGADIQRAMPTSVESLKNYVKFGYKITEEDIINARHRVNTFNIRGNLKPEAEKLYHLLLKLKQEQ
jgi:hypothetical protein